MPPFVAPRGTRPGDPEYEAAVVAHRIVRELRVYRPMPWRPLAELPAYHAGYPARGRHLKARCPECNGELRRWAAFDGFYPGKITFQCSGGHFIRFNHGVAFRDVTGEKVAAEYERLRQPGPEIAKDVATDHGPDVGS